MSWFLFLVVLAVLIVAARKTLDRETKSNMISLLKFIGGLFIALAVLAALTSMEK